MTERASTSSRVKATISVLLAVAGCSAPPIAVEPPAIPLDCIVSAAPQIAPDTIHVALLDAINPENVTHASNRSESLLFAQLYEALARIDCLDELRPELSSSWKRNAAGNVWTFTIDTAATYTDGTPVTAASIAEAFNRGSDPSLVDSAVARNAAALDIYFGSEHLDLPTGTATRPVGVPSDTRWSSGSGRLTITHDAVDRVIARATGKGPAAGATYVSFEIFPAADPRDVLSKPIDLMITSDPQAIGYASDISRLLTRPLPWDGTYVLVSPGRLRAMLSGEPQGTIAAEYLDAIAEDAVRADARASASPGWWDDLGDCRWAGTVTDHSSDQAASVMRPERHGLIVFDGSDPVAGDLAARIVALAAQEDQPPDGLAAAIPEVGNGFVLAAHGVDAAQFARQFQDGRDFLYLTALSSPTFEACNEARRLMAHAPWLHPLADQIGHALVPLVEVRSHVIFDPSRVGVAIDGRGQVIILTGGSTTSPSTTDNPTAP